MAAGDRQRLTCLMGDFHIRIAELGGNPILVDILRDLTARTILISMLYQSEFHAVQSHEGHCRIFEAMAGRRFRQGRRALRRTSGRGGNGPGPHDPPGPTLGIAQLPVAPSQDCVFPTGRHTEKPQSSKEK